MPHILKNQNLEIKIDLPLENYYFSRFDWTGKIVDVKFKNIQLSSVERTDCLNEHYFGKGFYNEFGIDTALGFDETDIGGWFHKIGIGLLKKIEPEYLFNKSYEIIPAEFDVITEANRMVISCKSRVNNGVAYLLKKIIELHDDGFTIHYYLKNTGEKDIVTTEYNHNFTAIDRDPMGGNYILKFSFPLKPELFKETVNPDQLIDIREDAIKFDGTPKEPFFFSQLTGGESVDAAWELTNLQSKIGISETVSFRTNKVNLWGWQHVICPEIFHNINIKPGESTEWFRRYKVTQLG